MGRSNNELTSLLDFILQVEVNVSYEDLKTVLRSVDECNEDDELAKSSAIEDRESGNEKETTRIDETLDDNRFRGKTGY